ncbi:MAG: HIT family protein [Kiritimatiellia bacterium]
MTDPTCIFCKIVNGEIPSRKVYEDENCFAFMDIAPFEKGHTLIVPRQHVELLTDMTAEALTQLILATQKVARHIVKALECDGFNLLQNNGECAKQTVPHVHFHIIPRWDRKQINWHSSKKYDSEEEITAIHKKISLDG